MKSADTDIIYVNQTTIDLLDEAGVNGDISRNEDLISRDEEE